MPKINYGEIPYEKKYSTGIIPTPKHSFYCPDENYEETSEQYRGYNAMDLFGLKVEDLSLQKNPEQVKRKVKKL